jgi:molybdopterin-guanine dinucleotide biosynthesis protein A
MGKKNKALLEVGGRSFIARTVERLRPLCGEIMIIGHDSEEYAALGLPVYQDLRPGNGSLGGIETALTHSSAPVTFCVACDMPFLQAPVLAHLLETAAAGWEAVVPRIQAGLEPLCSVYSPSLLPRISELIDGGEKRIRLALAGARVCFVSEEELRTLDPQLLTFVNINTPTDFEEVCRSLKGVES